MSYPKRLRIGDRTYRVRFVRSIRGCRKNTDGAVLGLFDPERIEILIKTGLSKDETLKTLIHEVGHAFEYEYDIRLSHRAIYQMEEAVFDFLVANSLGA